MTFQKDPQQNETKHLLQFASFPGKRVLEIGCGWGSFALEAARTTGWAITLAACCARVGFSPISSVGAEGAEPSITETRTGLPKKRVARSSTSFKWSRCAR